MSAFSTGRSQITKCGY